MPAWIPHSKCFQMLLLQWLVLIILHVQDRAFIGAHSHVRRCAVAFCSCNPLPAPQQQSFTEDSHRLTDQIPNSAGEHAGLLHAIHVQWSTVGATTPDAWWSGCLSVAWLRAGLQDAKLPFNSCKVPQWDKTTKIQFNCQCSRILTTWHDEKNWMEMHGKWKSMKILSQVGASTWQP